MKRIGVWFSTVVNRIRDYLRRLTIWLSKDEKVMPLNLEQLQAASDRLGAEVGETGDKVRADAAKIVALEAEVASLPGVQAKLDAIATSLTTSADALDALQATAQLPDPGVPVPDARRK